MNPRGTRAAAMAFLAAAVLVVADAVVVRRLGGGTQATALLCQWMVAAAAVPLVGLAVSARSLAARRLATGRGAAAGSAVKVATVAALGLGFAGAMAAFAAPFSRVVTLLPEPTTGAVYVYRIGLALPALGVGLTVAAGLLVVDGAAAVMPALVVLVVSQVAMALVWHARFGGLPGFELAGPGLAVPLGALLGSVTMGALLVASRLARERLAVHTGRPFAIGDLGPLVLGGLPASGAAALIVAGAAGWLLVVLGAGDDARIVGAVGTAGTAALGLALGHELLHRGGQRRVAALLALVMVAGAAAALAAPAALARALVAGAELEGRGLWAMRLLGVGLLQEVGLGLAAWIGWMRPRPPWLVELVALAAVLAALMGALLLLGEVQVTSAVLAVVLARGLVTPLLRRP